jgi:hypothetical protein
MGRIGDETGTQILLAASEVFTTAFTTTMGIFAVLALLAGLFTWWLMRAHEADPISAPEVRSEFQTGDGPQPPEIEPTPPSSSRP